MEYIAKTKEEIREDQEISKELFYTLGVKDSSTIKEATDWITVWKENGKREKYSKLMYSPSTNILRGTTFSEFYENGIVD